MSSHSSTTTGFSLRPIFGKDFSTRHNVHTCHAIFPTSRASLSCGLSNLLARMALSDHTQMELDTFMNSHDNRDYEPTVLFFRILSQFFVYFSIKKISDVLVNERTIACTIRKHSPLCKYLITKNNKKYSSKYWLENIINNKEDQKKYQKFFIFSLINFFHFHCQFNPLDTSFKLLMQSQLTPYVCVEHRR